METYKQSEQICVLDNNDISVEISNLGASIRSIRFAGSELTLGFSSQSRRVKSNTYSGAVIGRVANRIAGGKFTLNGTDYSLPRNDGENTLHGGKIGFDQRLFSAQTLDKSSIVMTLNSPDGDQGFPGTLTMRVEFVLDGASLTVRFSAVCDKDTFWAPTIHPYFRLGTEQTVDETYLQINADSYTPMGAGQIPTGEIASVEGTPLDFRQAKKIGKNINSAQLQPTGGYDHNFVLRHTANECAAVAFNETSGIKMEVFTDMPGLQFYSGNFLQGFNGTHDLIPREGFALEPQFFPNAVNTPSFDQPLLKKGAVVRHYIRYNFNLI